MGSGTAVFANFPGKGGRKLLSGGHTAFSNSLGSVPGLGRGGTLGGSALGCKCMDLHNPPPLAEQLQAQAQLADPAARPLQHPKMGGRKMGAIAEGEEREMLGVCPLSRRCDSLPGLRLGPACSRRVGGKSEGEVGGSSVPQRIAFRHVL